MSGAVVDPVACGKQVCMLFVDTDLNSRDSHALLLLALNTLLIHGMPDVSRLNTIRNKGPCCTQALQYGCLVALYCAHR